jgi:tRNA (adenine22-N1)-methyltransferase
MARNNRLFALAESIKGYHRVLDIGCDHGLVLKYALDSKYIQSGIASDIASKPLESAKSNLETYPVSFVLSDGFKQINETFDVVIIAGLGGHTIIDILKDAPSFDFDLVLMPHDRLDQVRHYLSMNHYGIISERIVFDKHYYTIFHINKRKMNLSEKEMYTGKHVIFDHNACAYFSLQHKKHQILALKADHEKALLFHKIAQYYKEVSDECITKSTTF